jgi:hypothetical protein
VSTCTHKIAVERTQDAAYVDEVTKTLEVWIDVIDDTTPPREQFTLAPLVANEAHVFLRVEHEGAPAGYVAFYRMGYGGYEMHTVLLPNCRGAAALRAGWTAVAWLFEHTEAKGIRTYVFEHARPARRMMAAARWPIVGREPHPNRVEGKPARRIWYQLTREAWEQRKPKMEEATCL